jgi:hypothetical protein
MIVHNLNGESGYSQIIKVIFNDFVQNIVDKYGQKQVFPDNVEKINLINLTKKN